MSRPVRCSTLVTLALAATLCPFPSAAQTWPSQTVRIINPFSPGGNIDITGRLLAQRLSEQTGGTFVLENRPGAAATIGAAFVAKAPPDGHTLLISAPEMSTHAAFHARLPYDPLKDFALISQLTAGHFVLASHPSVPVKTVKDVIALAKARPGQLNYGSSGTGAVVHLAGELFGAAARIRWEHVPFKGSGSAVIGLMTGETEFAFASTASVAGPARAGKVRFIALTGPLRLPEFPDIPTIAESGMPGYSVTGWHGFYAPAGTPTAIVQRLYQESRRAFGTPEAKALLAKSGNEPVVSSPEEFAAFLRSEIAKWTKLAREGTLKKVD